MAKYYSKSRGFLIDTKQVKEGLLSMVQSVQDATAERGERLLQAIVDALEESESNRRTAYEKASSSIIQSYRPTMYANIRLFDNAKVGPSRGTVDNPFREAKVIIQTSNPKKKGIKSRMTFYVEHYNQDGKNLFAILDAGVPDGRVAKKTFVFPAYVGHVTPAGGFIASGVATPESIKSAFDPNGVKFVTTSKGKVLLRGVTKGTPIKGIPARYFYRAIANALHNLMMDEGVIAPKGSALSGGWTPFKDMSSSLKKKVLLTDKEVEVRYVGQNKIKIKVD